MVKIQNLVDKPVNQGNGQVKGEIEQKLSPNTLPETCPPSENKFCGVFVIKNSADIP